MGMLRQKLICRGILDGTDIRETGTDCGRRQKYIPFSVSARPPHSARLARLPSPACHRPKIARSHGNGGQA